MEPIFYESKHAHELTKCLQVVMLRFNCISLIFVSLIVGGSLFLFDRKVLRLFRKDGHNWRKKKDGKTVIEAPERLKVSRVECY